MTRWMRLWALGLLLAVVALGRSAAAEVVISDEARDHFKRGVALLQAADGPSYQQAYVAFQRAYAASPSPKILGNLGLCALKLERDGEAIEAYERYLAEAGAVNDTEQRQVIEELVKLKGRVSPVRLTVSPLKAVVVDERLRDDGPPVVNRYVLDNGRLRTGIRQGLHRVTIEAEGYRSVVWEFEARRGIARENTVQLKKLGVDPDAPSAPQPDGADSGVGAGFVVAAALAGAFTAATVVVGSLALAKKSSFEEALDAGDEAEAEQLRDTGITLNVTTDVLLASALVSGAVAVVLLFTGGEDDETAGWLLTPLGAEDGAGLMLSGAF